MVGPNERPDRKLRATAVTNTSDKSLPFGFLDVVVKMHPGEAPFQGKGRWHGEEELLSAF